MRKVLIIALLALFGTASLSAQDMSPKKAFRQAKRNLSSFELDNSKVDELNGAVDMIMAVAKDEEFKNDPEVWNTMGQIRSEEHTSELQSRENLVCRLLLEKK